MHMVSIRLSDELYATMMAKAKALDLSQTEYIREAIEHMNAQAHLAGTFKSK